MMDWYDGNWAQATWMMLTMFVFWGGLIALSFWLVSRLTRSEDRPMAVESPRQILDRRLASGEIDTEEYAEARRALGSLSSIDPSTHR